MMTLKLKVLLILIGLTVIMVPAIAFGQDALDPKGFTEQVGLNSGYNTDINTQTGLASFLGGLVRNLLSFIGLLFVVYVIYGGYLWLTSAGNEEKVEKAKKIIRDGTIGLIVILLAVAIYIFIIYALAGESIGEDINADVWIIQKEPIK